MTPTRDEIEKAIKIIEDSLAYISNGCGIGYNRSASIEIDEDLERSFAIALAVLTQALEPQFNSMAELKRKRIEVEQNSIRIIAEIEKLQQENKRYREALEKLANTGNITAKDALNEGKENNG